PSPLAAVVERYAATDESASPLARERAARERLPVMQSELLAALPAPLRPGVRLLLTHAARTLPLRGVGKASFLQALHVPRVSARRVGEHLASAGVLAEKDDVFYLTVDEIVRGLPSDNGVVQDLVSRRRDRRAEYQRLELPSWWRGTPQPTEIPETDDSGDDVT